MSRRDEIITELDYLNRELEGCTHYDASNRDEVKRRNDRIRELEELLKLLRGEY